MHFTDYSKRTTQMHISGVGSNKGNKKYRLPCNYCFETTYISCKFHLVMMLRCVIDRNTVKIWSYLLWLKKAGSYKHRLQDKYCILRQAFLTK